MRAGRQVRRVDGVAVPMALGNSSEVSLGLQSRSVLENLLDRAASGCARIGINPLTVCLR